MLRSSQSDWNNNLNTIVNGHHFVVKRTCMAASSVPYDENPWHQINHIQLWEDDENKLELDFEADEHDIQIRSVNRDEKNIKMANDFPNSHIFFTYRHSLRSYASIHYLGLLRNFRIILRGKDVEHHNVVNDMMMSQNLKYRPHGDNVIPKDKKVIFHKDANLHVDVQGINVYHKNRLIMPFWRISTGRDIRCVICVVSGFKCCLFKPAHEKQGFEKTIVFQRFERQLRKMQTTYWNSNCHRIGYAARCNKNLKNVSDDKETSPDYFSQTSPPMSRSKRSVPNIEDTQSQQDCSPCGGTSLPTTSFMSRGNDANDECSLLEGVLGLVEEERKENHELKQRLEEKEADLLQERGLVEEERKENRELKQRLEEKEADLLRERDRCKSLETQLEVEQLKIEALFEVMELGDKLNTNFRKQMQEDYSGLCSILGWNIELSNNEEGQTTEEGEL